MKGDKRQNFVRNKGYIESALRDGRPRKAVYLELQASLDMSYSMFCEYANALVEFDSRPARPRKAKRLAVRPVRAETTPKQEITSGNDTERNGFRKPDGSRADANALFKK